MSDPAAILDFWFADGPQAFRPAWFTKDPAFDADIAKHFSALIVPARDGALDAWATTPRGTLALLLLLDQFPRNLFRGAAESFASDPHALAIARASVLRDRQDLVLSPVERIFLYLPFEHGEALADQDLSVALFEGLRDVPAMAAPKGVIDFAWRHRAVITRFGRFPHRNAALGRANRPGEESWLEDGGGF